MKHLGFYQCLGTLVTLTILSINLSINCEHVFVLDDSSEPAKASLVTNDKFTTDDQSNTRIITDEEKRPITTTSSSSNQNSKPKNNKDQQSHIVDDNQDSPSAHQARRLSQDEKPQLNPQTRSTVTRNGDQLSQPANQPRTRATTSSSLGNERDHSSREATTSGQVPKTEERLLISISSDDDDYKSVVKPVNGGGSSQHDDPVSSQSGPQKRKPSITISIQDPNGNKLSGSSSGPPSVIVRPTENGQGILISTVNSGASDNKYNTKPNHNEQPPYREPTNNHYQPSSTTYRPLPVSGNDYGNRPISGSSSSNRPPIISTLLDPPSRPINGLNDEQPSRPTNNLGISDLSPSSKPVRPTSLDSLPPPATSSYDLDSDSPRPTNSNQNNQQFDTKYPLNERNCGTMHETRIVGGDEANPNDFLWMAAIIRAKPTSGEAKPFCGGSLITRRHILTAAHCLENLGPRDVLVRLGSYDFDDATASSTSADYAIDQFRVPANYSKKTHVADIAIMRLKTPLSTNDNYKTVCMPQPRRSYVGALGTVTGYGSQSETFRRATPKLRQVVVPIWENRKCSVVYKRNLTESFLCAGYEEGGKDACQGDSGGPLMTEGPNEKMMVVGVVSHGIGCGSPGYPGVYTRTTTFMEWIEKNTRE